MHSPTARTHHEMLHIFCEICGVKKNSHQARKINPALLEKRKSFSGYANYDITDERFPKVLCKIFCKKQKKNKNKISPPYRIVSCLNRINSLI